MITATPRALRAPSTKSVTSICIPQTFGLLADLTGPRGPRLTSSGLPLVRLPGWGQRRQILLPLVDEELAQRLCGGQQAPTRQFNDEPLAYHRQPDQIEHHQPSICELS